MAHVLPFRAWRYDPQRVPIQQVVTQPYDKITPAMQDGYYNANPYNLVQIILGKHLPADTKTENVYTRAAGKFEDWRRGGILRRDVEPSIYRYSQTFDIPAAAQGHPARIERKAFIALGRLESYSENVVFRHEHTLAKPKADRLELLRATNAQFEQLFMLYGAGGKIDAMLEVSAPPDIEVTDEYKGLHRLWKISDPAIIASVQRQMRERKLLIADGHHRYETALAYRTERRAAEETESGSGRPIPYESTMMTFVDMDRPGLVILPTHRLVFGLPAFSEQKFEAEVQNFFTGDPVAADVDAASATAMLQQKGQSGTALLAVMPSRAFLLHTPKTSATDLLNHVSARQQTLDVVQLHKCVLEGVLKISEEAIRNQENVTYCRDGDEALSQVRNGKVQIAFLMNPARMDQVREIAFAGEVLPQKSTDFYPKLLSGLTIYSL
jgi:uncharacterized protein (DUF1015 family)